MENYPPCKENKLTGFNGNAFLLWRRDLCLAFDFQMYFQYAFSFGIWQYRCGIVFSFLFRFLLLRLDPKYCSDNQGDNLKWKFTIYSFFIAIVSLMVGFRALEASNMSYLQPFKHYL